MRSLPFRLAVLVVALVALVLWSGTGRAQQRPGANPNNAAAAAATPTGSATPAPNGFWRCELPGGVYLVALRNIQSVSMHEYVVDGAARVTEVTVATNSSVEGRFYFLEPMTVGTVGANLQQLQQHVQDLTSNHAGPDDKVWEKVVKNYPATTHAHTVEYRLTRKESLQQLYTSLEQAWMTGRGASLKTE